MSTKIVNTRGRSDGWGSSSICYKRTYDEIQEKHKAMTYPIELHVLYSIMLPIYSTEVIGIVW